jgi:hypothetical protein
MRTLNWFGLGAAAVTVLACSPAGADPNGTGSTISGGGSAPGAGSIPTGAGSIPNGTGSIPNGAGGLFLSTGGSGSGPQDQDAACKAVEQKAERTLGGKADIIWVLDGSLSMVEEAAAIQSKLNEFANFITGTGIDAHVVIIGACETGAPQPVDRDFGLLINACGVSIGAPLGSGQACPNDSNPPPNGNFLHVLRAVDSHNALDRLQATYPDWQSMIRPDSTKTIVVVTDDSANPSPTPADFTNFFNQQWAGSLWRFSGVFCIPGQAGNGCAGTGDTYAQLVAQTGGVQTNLPTADWNVVFQQLGDAVVADAKPVDCEWAIPPPPAGEALDPAKVNVEFTPSSGVPQLVYPVASSGACTDQFLSWYYDDPIAPKRVIACPQTCPTLQADDNAKIEVLFGCAQEPPPIH